MTGSRPSWNSCAMNMPTQFISHMPATAASLALPPLASPSVVYVSPSSLSSPPFHGLFLAAAHYLHPPTTQELARYLAKIVPPVLACFTDQDARVRYYACEAMYNIAKVAKGEILIYFNDIFDALCKVRDPPRPQGPPAICHVTYGP